VETIRYYSALGTENRVESPASRQQNRFQSEISTHGFQALFFLTASTETMSLLENDSGDDGEVRHKRFDFPAPSLPGVIDFFINDGVSEVQAAILLNQTPQEIHQMKKHIRCYLRAPCPWNTPEDLTTDDGTILCRKNERPLGWMMPASKQGELFRHLIIPPVAKLYPDLFVEPDLETQIRQDQPNTYGRFKYAPFVVCREVLIRLIETCAQDMRAIPW
jgi:hypothetical protein